MSLDWKIDSETRLITAVADGDVSRRDIEALLDEMASRGAMTYRARVLGMLAAADRPMRVFRTPVPARRWLKSLEKKKRSTSTPADEWLRS